MELKYPKLPIDCFPDDQRKFSEAYDDSSPVDPEEPGEIEDPDLYIQRHIDALKLAPQYYDGVGAEHV